MPLLSSATGRCFAAHVSREAIAPLLRTELARARQLGRTDLPRKQAELSQLLKDVRAHGMARVVDTLLPGIAGFCAPVFDFDGHMVLGIVAMGSVATVDTAWNGAVATALGQAARQLSHELGHTG
jgi:DNA-binding IclR family transcriptional regulator